MNRQTSLHRTSLRPRQVRLKLAKASRIPKTLLLVILLITTACDSAVIFPPQPTPAPGLAMTLAVQTMQADSSFSGMLYTSTPLPPTATTPPTYTPLPTLTGQPSRTPLPTLAPEQLNPTLGLTPTAIILEDGTVVPCNAAEFLKDVTVPDDMIVTSGEKFTKVWLLKNVGGCTWTPRYSLVLIWGEEFGTEPPIPLNKVVKPGEEVEISIDMVAPYLPLCYQGNWMLQDEAGNRFGTGFMYQEFFWVSVSVALPGLKNVRFG
ncbi:MAG: hypothetical protein JXB15_03965 [Anaerolineales bacterium]|nr:hypothetical protein [Anaerolineales bacterium]